ncbi:MAG: hypothetical protein JO017_06465, partial [Actinobacteria bacterium]|nr:hypothetical protein [Actinomycetota bacterium]
MRSQGETMKRFRWLLPVLAAVAAVSTTASTQARNNATSATTRTPIKHVVVIFQENVSFDHYFGTYPYARGTDGQPFVARPGTPPVNGLLPTVATLATALQHTTNLISQNANAATPQRLDSSPTGNAQ